MTDRMPAELVRKAACKGMVSARHDPWHPPAGGKAPAQYAEAREVCADCPVLESCRRYALDLLEQTGQVRGMFAGLTPVELRRLARSLGRPSRKAAQHGSRSRYVSWRCRCRACRDANARYKAGQGRAS